MSAPGPVADALALAFLAGAWNGAALVERASAVLGERPTWLEPLVQHLLAQFAVAPNDEPAKLSRTILGSPSFKRANAPGLPRPKLVKLVVGQPSMAERRWAVPVLTTSAEVAAWLDVTSAELDWFADVRGLNACAAPAALHHYLFHWRPKRRGSHRLVEAPKPRLKAIQQRVLHEILDRVPVHAAAHGFVRGRSVLTCARVHAARDVVVRFDLEEFFPSIGAARIRGILRRLGYPENVARILTGLCSLRVSSAVLDTAPPLSFAERYDVALIEARRRARSRLRERHLPQGAPTSPALANLAAFRLDTRLDGAARAVGASYTRYADDLVFSGDRTFARRALRFESLVGAIALEEGFMLNHHKTRVMGRAQSQRFLGLVTNVRPNVPRVERERVEAILTNIVKHGLESQNRDWDPHFLDSLRGRVARIEHVNPKHATKLRRLLAACDARD
jgi:hypothetical protein